MSSSRSKGNISALLKFLTMAMLLFIALVIVVIATRLNSGMSSYNDPQVASNVIGGTLYDSTGRALSLEVPVYRLYIDDPDEEETDISSQIISIISNMTPDRIKALMEEGRSAFTSNDVSQMEKLELAFRQQAPSVSYRIERNIERTYPAMFHACQVIDETERAYESIIRPLPGYGEKTTTGKDINLTIDLDCQYLLDLAVQDVYQVQSPSFIYAFIMEIPSGAMRAMTYYPFYDLNQKEEIPEVQRENRTMISSIELEDGIDIYPYFIESIDGQESSSFTPDKAFTTDNEQMLDMLENLDGTTSILRLVPAENPKYAIFIGSYNAKYHSQSTALTSATSDIIAGLSAQNKL